MRKQDFRMNNVNNSLCMGNVKMTKPPTSRVFKINLKIIDVRGNAKIGAIFSRELLTVWGSFFPQIKIRVVMKEKVLKNRKKVVVMLQIVDSFESKVWTSGNLSGVIIRPILQDQTHFFPVYSLKIRISLWK